MSRLYTIIKTISISILLVGHPAYAASLLSSINWGAGSTTNNQTTTTTFRAGATADGGKSFATSFTVKQKIDVLVDIKPTAEHIGKVVKIYYVAKHNEQWYTKNAKGEWQVWDFKLSNLIPFSESKILQAEENLEVQQQLTNLVGTFTVFVGYQVDDVIYFNNVALKFTVDPEEQPAGNAPVTPQPPVIAVTNATPVAVAESYQDVNEGTQVTLNASKSSDADGKIVKYLWEQTSGTPAALSTTNSATLTFIAPEVNRSIDLHFKLTVTDDGGAVASDFVDVTVRDVSIVETYYPSVPTCSVLQVLQNGICVAVVPSCTAPQILQNGLCVTPTPTCNSQQVLQNGVCITPVPICVSPQELQNGVCITPTPTCVLPQVLQNGICVTPTPICVPPQELQNGVCVTPTPTCVLPQILQNGVCVTPTPTCEAPQVLENGVCVVPQIPVTGGTIEITDAKSPIYHAKMVIEGDTIVGPETITLSYEDNLPAPLNSDALALGGQQVSKVLVINRSGSVDFAKSVNVVIPFDTTKLPRDSVPIVVYWDPTTNSYSPVAIRSIDWDNGLITFVTAHASKYVVLVLNYLTGANTAIDTTRLSSNVGFDPLADSFFIHNFGSYDSPGGNCFGMAAYSAWYQFAKKSSKGQGLFSLYKEGDVNKEEDDQIARELIASVYQVGDQKAHVAALNQVNDHKLTRLQEDRFTAYSIIQQFIVTRQAQILVMGIGGLFNWSDGHAVTVYAYDGVNKQFLYYDNNFPGETVNVPWDPVNGFGTNTKNKAYDVYAFAAFNSAYSATTLESMFNAAEAGFPASHYPKIVLSAPTVSATNPNSYEVATDVNVSIKGTVARPTSAANTNAQRYVHLYLNGVQRGAFAVDQSTDKFDITIAKLPNLVGTDVMLFVSEDARAWAIRPWSAGFHAFKQFKISVANQFFFKNLGFETGDFSSWLSERHVWGSSQQVTPSDKSAILTGSGFDPIATDLHVPLFGNYVGRVNNSDNSYHISSLTQTATVPQVNNPVVRFYWSAVLEDPQHDPQDQPYVDIVVLNTSKQIELYRKRFYSNDPSYSGWLSYQSGQWKSIPWQLVELNVTQYIGDTLELKVEAADCALGGHGGYAYIDVEETAASQSSP